MFICYTTNTQPKIQFISTDLPFFSHLEKRFHWFLAGILVISTFYSYGTIHTLTQWFTFYRHIPDTNGIALILFVSLITNSYLSTLLIWWCQIYSTYRISWYPSSNDKYKKKCDINAHIDTGPESTNKVWFYAWCWHSQNGLSQYNVICERSHGILFMSSVWFKTIYNNVRNQIKFSFFLSSFHQKKRTNFHTYTCTPSCLKRGIIIYNWKKKKTGLSLMGWPECFGIYLFRIFIIFCVTFTMKSIKSKKLFVRMNLLTILHWDCQCNVYECNGMSYKNVRKGISFSYHYNCYTYKIFNISVQIPYKSLPYPVRWR